MARRRRCSLLPRTEEVADDRPAGRASIGVPLVPQGGNTGMAAGATPPGRRLGAAAVAAADEPHPLDRSDGGLRSPRPASSCHTLHDAADEVGLRFPLTLGARGSCTIGGLASTNAGGTQVLRFGTMRALVAGVEAVLARRLDPRRPVGAQEGQSRLQPRPVADRRRRHARRGHRGRAAAGPGRRRRAPSPGRDWTARSARSSCCASSKRDTAAVEGFELVPDDSLQLVLRHIPGTRAPLAGKHRWHVLIEATTADAVRPIGTVLERLLGEALDAGPHRGRDDRRQRGAGRSLLENSRQHFGGRARRRARRSRTTFRSRSLPCRASSSTPRPRSRRAFPGVIASGFGHLGDGNVHFHVRAGQPRARRTGTRTRARRSRAWSTISSRRRAARSRPSTASAS